ncbi:MAG: hypothetical protein J5805_07500 [Bacteroidaceae bacterium]|nr:hypothetical protein [Bacteroidaceae bacterium]
MDDTDITPQQKKRILYLVSQEYKEPPIYVPERAEKLYRLDAIRGARYRKIEEIGHSFIYERYK